MLKRILASFVTIMAGTVLFPATVSCESMKTTFIASLVFSILSILVGLFLIFPTLISLKLAFTIGPNIRLFIFSTLLFFIFGGLLQYVALCLTEHFVSGFSCTILARIIICILVSILSSDKEESKSESGNNH